MGELRDSVGALQAGSIRSPIDLTDIPKGQARVLGQERETEEKSRLLWKCAKCAYEFPATEMIHKFHIDPRALPTLLKKLEGETLEGAPAFKQYSEKADALGLGRNFAGETPVGEVRALAKADSPPDPLRDFLESGADVNIPRTVKKSIQTVRSGITSYVNFCVLLGSAVSPQPPAWWPSGSRPSAM